MIDALNDIRTRAGLPALAPNVQLANAAQRHVVDLASGRVDLNNSHVGSDGSTVAGRVTATGYPLQSCLEMTGWGWDGDATRAVDYWMQSQTHWPIIHDATMTEAGWAYLYQPGAQWGHYWVVVLARRVGQPDAPQGNPEPPPTVYVPVVTGGREVPPSGAVDLLPYLRGDGRAYMVRHPSGAQEKFRTVDLGGGRWLQLKNSQWEEFRADGQYIYRGADTSAGDGQYYRQFEDGSEWARWCPRYMTIGQSWAAPVPHTVQTYDKGDCRPVDHHRNGRATNALSLAARYERMTFSGVVIEDVIELRTHTGERMFWGRGWGLCAWKSAWGSSEVVQVLPPHEADNEPERGCFGP